MRRLRCHRWLILLTDKTKGRSKYDTSRTVRLERTPAFLERSRVLCFRIILMVIILLYCPILEAVAKRVSSTLL